MVVEGTVVEVVMVEEAAMVVVVVVSVAGAIVGVEEEEGEDSMEGKGEVGVKGTTVEGPL